MPDQDAPLRQSRSSRIAIALLALATLWCLYWFVHARHYWEDDAYIHLEFARSLAAGRGFSFNGHVVAGDTAPLWVFLLAGIHSLIPDWLVAGKLLSALGVALGLSGAYAFARRLAAKLLPPQTAAIFPAAVVLLVVANPYFCYWAYSGMEPLAASGLAFFAVLAATRDRPSIKSFLIASLLTGLAPLLRPEMIFLTALLALPLLAQWRRIPVRPSSLSRPTAFLSGLLLLVGPTVLWSLYSLHAFGHLLPNTNAAKRAAASDSILRHLLSIYSFGFPLILCGLLAGVAYLLMRPASVRRSLAAAIATEFRSSVANEAAHHAHSLPLAGWIFLLWPAIATLFYIANHTYVQTRYILVTAPGLTLVILILALQASRHTGRVLYAAALIAALAVSLISVRPFIRNKAINCQITASLGEYMRDRLLPEAPVAVYSIGEIAFVSQHPIIDIGGITRPGAIPYLNAPPETMLGWARTQGAQYFIGERPEPNAILVFAADQRFIGWSLHPALYDTTNSLELWKLTPLTPNH
ncbi:MAG: hypothetical protein P4K80_03440 [Acidobacteriaceae bacterium]|nr:hypothetical protein [Acidobacteriaceae bacterium]